MNKLIFALIGAAIGGFTGFFIGKASSKKRYEKELKEKTESIKSTYDALLEKAKKEAAEKIASIEEAKNEEKDDDDGNGKVDVVKASYEEAEDEDYSGYGAEYDDYEKELRDARAEFLKEVEEEYGSRGEPYNISEDVYNEPFPGFGKGTIMIDESIDKAYDQDGMEVEDWHVVVGDSYGTLEEDRQDEYGRIFIRCPRVAMDYEVTWSNIELAH